MQQTRMPFSSVVRNETSFSNHFTFARWFGVMLFQSSLMTASKMPSPNEQHAACSKSAIVKCAWHRPPLTQASSYLELTLHSPETSSVPRRNASTWPDTLSCQVGRCPAPPERSYRPLCEDTAEWPDSDGVVEGGREDHGLRKEREDVDAGVNDVAAFVAERPMLARLSGR